VNSFIGKKPRNFQMVLGSEDDDDEDDEDDRGGKNPRPSCLLRSNGNPPSSSEVRRHTPRSARGSTSPME